MSVDKKESNLYWLCALGLFRLPFVEILITAMSLLHLTNYEDYADLIFYVVYVIFIIAFVVKNRMIEKRVFLSALSIVALMLGGYVISMICGESSYILDPNFSIIKIALFFSSLMLVFSSINDIDSFCTFATRISSILITFEFLIFIRGAISGRLQTSNYNMTGGYVLALLFLFEIKEFERYKRLTNLFFMILAAIQILIIASRGALLLIAISSVLFFVKRITEQKYKVLIILIATIVISYLFINFDTIIFTLSGVLEKAGIQSRNVTAILNFANQTDSDRGNLQKTVLMQLKDMPILGYGLCGSWKFIGTYSHNFICDALIEWGIPLGIAIITWTIIMAIKSIVNIRTRRLATILVLYFVVHNMLSSTYLHDETFWCMVGVFINCKRNICN